MSPTHSIRSAAAWFLLALLWVGCGGDELDDNRGITGGFGNNGSEDAGSDVGDAGARRDAAAVDPRCENLQSGAFCELPSAAGICVGGVCQFLSCEAGFRDCDSNLDNGCETDITADTSCGACGVSCQQPETCQLSFAGWVCSVSPVCPDDAYDLDGDTPNGCEWRGQWGGDGAFNPPSLQPDVAVEFDTVGFAVAGRSTDARLVSSTGAAEQAEPLPLAVDPDAPAAAVDAVRLRAGGGAWLLGVAWEDGLTLSRANGSGADDGVFQYACDDSAGSIARSFVGVAGGSTSPIFAVTEYEILRVDRGTACATDPSAATADRQLCDQPAATFGTTDYLTAYHPGVDATACAECEPDANGCPDFEPIGAQWLADSGELVVFTNSGFLLVEPGTSDFTPGPRFEADDVIIVAGAAEEDGQAVRVYLLTASGTLRRFVVDRSGTDSPISPAGSEVGLPADATDGAARLTPGPDDVLLVTDARGAWLVRPLRRSGRIEPLAEPDVFLGDGRTIFGAGADASGFSMLYYGLGRFYLRDVLR